jgi:WD40 repeat protein
VLLGFEDMIFGVAVSPDGRFVAGASSDHTTRVWDLASLGSRLAASHGASVPGLAVSPDGKLIASASVDGDARLTNAASVLPESAAIALPVGTLSGLRGRKVAPKRLLFSPDGRRLARAGEDGALEVWRTPGGGDPMVLSGHTGAVQEIVFSSDGRFLYSAGADKTVRRWDWDQGSGVVLYEHAGSVSELALSLDGALLASGGEDQVVRVWHLGEGRDRSLSGHGAFITAVAFSPDGRSVLTGSQDHTFRVWDLEGGGSEIHGVAGPMLDIAFSPDGRSFFMRGFMHPLQRWDAAAWRRLNVYRGHAAPIWDFAIAPGGSRVVTGSVDRTARITDLATGEGRALAGAWDEVLEVAYMPDGRAVVSSGKDGVVRLFIDDLPEGAEELQAWLKGAVPEVIQLGPEEGEQRRSD